MATCPAGHQTNQTDFCDVCGLAVVGVDAPAIDAPAAPATITCPNCSTGNVAAALFCEACGYDFTTGSLPAPAEAPAWPTLTPVPTQPQAAPADEQPQPDAPTPPPVPAPASPNPDTAAPSPQPAEAATVEWVAELWIDPDWYAAQGSTDPMPSVGLPDIVALTKASNLIGRVSHSRGIFPDIDCELDSGCSRRHAMLSTDGTRWWIEDLNSANGTFVGSIGAPLPAMPIPQGRVELADGQRIYVGAWTRIAIRKATPDEQEALSV